MTKVRKDETLPELNINIDNLMIDMNGLFHTSAQKVYEYGNFKPNTRLLGRKPQVNNLKLQIKVFEDICKQVDNIFRVVNPTKRIIMCVDGPAPLGKQLQQSKRRYVSALECGEMDFDPNCISPGTKFMDHLNKYIDWYIRNRIINDEKWRELEVIFSNEKAAGEGESKILNYVRKYGDPKETFCMFGLDADLIMLSLGTHFKNYYILREDLYDVNNDFFCINIGSVGEHLSEIMEWECPKYEFNKTRSIDDFVFLCFIVGNDFLPHIPSIEIIENGIELILQVYKQVGSVCGHITKLENDQLFFVHESLKLFLNTIGMYEKELFENKLSKKDFFFPDKILEDCSKLNDKGRYDVDIEKYREEYIKKSFEDSDIETVCHKYFEGMQWVLTYYTKGVPNWKWFYPHHYAPSATILSKYIDTFKFPIYLETIPSTPFQQLLCILPPKSAGLIPHPLCKLLTDKESPIKHFCPEKFEIDLAGKRKQWEGIPLLPIIDFNLVRDNYFLLLPKVEPKELKRNIRGKSNIYKYSEKCSYDYYSFYGNILKCPISAIFIDL